MEESAGNVYSYRRNNFFSTKMKEDLCTTIEGFILVGSSTVRVDSIFPMFCHKHLLESLSNKDVECSCYVATP